MNKDKEKINWGMIGAIASSVAAIVAIILGWNQLKSTIDWRWFI